MQAEPEVLKWERRWPQILAEIARFDPDIVCLQEACAHVQPSLAERGFEGTPAGPPLPGVRAKHECCRHERVFLARAQHRLERLHAGLGAPRWSRSLSTHT